MLKQAKRSSDNYFLLLTTSNLCTETVSVTITGFCLPSKKILKLTQSKQSKIRCKVILKENAEVKQRGMKIILGRTLKPNRKDIRLQKNFILWIVQT